MAHAVEIKCAIANCGNIKSFVEEIGREIYFYKFPENKDLRKRWVEKCSKGDDWDPTGHYICSEHFLEEDFEPCSGCGSPIKRLRTTAAPIVNLYVNWNAPEITVNEGKEFPGVESEEEEASTSKESNIDSQSFIATESYERLLQNYQKATQVNDDLKRYLCMSRRTIDTKARQIRKLERELADVNKQLKTQRSQLDRFEQALKYFFTGAEKELVISRKVDGEWNTDTLVRTLSIRYLSERCYDYLCQNLVYALPDLHSLQKWISSINLRQGIVQEFIAIMEVAAKELSDIERIAVLQFGNMKVKPLYEYKEETDEVVGPYSNMQAVIVTGLFANWKQPIYLSFDKKITGTILLDLIRKLHSVSYTVMACVSDWYEGMTDLWKLLRVNSQHTYFRHPVTEEKIHFFVEAACLLRTTRNLFIKDGFKLDSGKIINTEPIKKLLSSSKAEFRYPLLQQKHLEPSIDDSEDLKLAEQLFCVENARYLKSHNSESFYSTGAFIENISKWYIIARQDYGKIKYEDNFTLTATIDTILNLSVAKDTPSHQLQEAMLITMNSLKLLPTQVWNKYNNTLTIRTEKLNNKELKDLFQEIVCEQGAVTPLEAVDKLRAILLGSNKDNGYLINRVLNSLNYTEVRNQEVDIVAVPTRAAADNDQSTSSIVYTEDDEVHYLIASVAEKYITYHPELGKRISDLDMDAPYKKMLASIGNLVEPSQSWANQARQLNKIFTKYHKKQLLSGKPDLTKKITDIVKNDYPDINMKVAKCFLQERLMLRMKYLNKELEKLHTSSEEETLNSSSEAQPEPTEDAGEARQD